MSKKQQHAATATTRDKTEKHTEPWLVMGNQRNGHYDFVLPEAKDKDFQANARIISAAPVMLAALLECERELSLAVKPGWTTATLNIARAAIAKATGE